MVRGSASALLLVASLLAGGARAAESCVLSYVRGQGAEQCPDEARVRQAVAARLGYDPFVAWAKTTVHAQIVREGSLLRGRLFLADAENRARGSRELTAPADRCDELVAALALAISIAVDPMQASRGVPAPPPLMIDHNFAGIFGWLRRSSLAS